MQRRAGGREPGSFYNNDETLAEPVAPEFPDSTFEESGGSRPPLAQELGVEVMRPAVSQTCTLPAEFEKDFSGLADDSQAGVEFWLTKLEQYLESHSVAEVRSLLNDRGLTACAASYQGGLLASQGEARKVTWEHFLRRLDLLAELEIPTLVLVPDYQGPFTHTDIERGQVSLHQAGQEAAKRGIRIALEFQAKNTFLNNLETTIQFVYSVQHPSVGICLDLFHLMTGPSKLHDLVLLTPANLFHVQISDLADVPREMASDSDRIMPGDGDFPILEVIEQLRQREYSGFVSLELFNPRLYTIAPQQVGEIGLTAVRRALGQARPR